jgi:hypothetical protein
MPSFHTPGNVCVAKLRLKINFSKEAKIIEQSLRTKLGIPSNPAYFVDHSHWKPLQSSPLTKAGVKVLLYVNAHTAQPQKRNYYKQTGNA